MLSRRTVILDTITEYRYNVKKETRTTWIMIFSITERTYVDEYKSPIGKEPESVGRHGSSKIGCAWIYCKIM